MTRKLISVVTPCFNEEENVRDVWRAVREQFENQDTYDYEHIFIDNASTDRTVAILKEIGREHSNVKLIVNSRNFGVARSPFYALLQTRGDAVLVVMADLQDPPQMIPDFLREWEKGFKMVLAIKDNSDEAGLMFAVRTLYYRAFNRLCNLEIVEHFSGYGLYDKRIIDILRSIDDPYPDLRSLLGEIGFERAYLHYHQPKRQKGSSKNHLYALFEQAMLGITAHSKVPLRLATLTGFVIAASSLAVAFLYFIYKLAFWNSFSVGLAPVVIGLFFFSAVQLIFIGIAGEYIGFIYTQVRRRPLVIEKERVNFGPGDSLDARERRPEVLARD